MSYLVEVPSGDAGPIEYADWAEIQALLAADGNVSREDLARGIRRPGMVSEETARNLADDVFGEVADRAQACNLGAGSPHACYPFALSDDQQLVEVRTSSDNFDSGLLYLFLLAISRWSMDSRNRKLAQVDPTETFERLCADVLASYWGGRTSYSDTYVVGTSVGRRKRAFPKEVDTLCGHLGEGQGWKKGAKNPGTGDGGLDIAVWRRFSDKRAGSLVGFAQCKTGIHWEDEVGKLDARAFCGNYMKGEVLVDPVGIYMVPHRLPRDEWDHWTRRARGLFFDRCRIVQYAHAVAKSHLDDGKAWLTEAIGRSRSA